MASTLAGAVRAIDDWISGPAALVDELRRSSPGVEVAARLSEDGMTLTVTPRAGRRAAPPAAVSLRADPDRLPLALAPLVKDKAVDLAIPASWVIARRIDLPIEAASHIDGIVASRISALSPLPPSDIYYGHRTLSAGRDAKQITVAVAVVPRARVAASLAALAAAQARQVGISAPFPEAGAVAVLTRRQEGTGSRGRVKGGLAALLGVCVVASIIAAAGRPLLAERFADRRAALELRADKARSAIVAAATPERAETPPEQEAVKLKDDSISVLGALDDLALALPLHSYATGIAFAEGRLRLTGRTQDVPEVLTALESSGRFADSKLVGPARRSEDGMTSEFEVDTRPLIRTGGAVR